MTKQTPKKYVKSELHPKSFVSNFWGAVQNCYSRIFISSVAFYFFFFNT